MLKICSARTIVQALDFIFDWPIALGCYSSIFLSQLLSAMFPVMDVPEDIALALGRPQERITMLQRGS